MSSDLKQLADLFNTAVLAKPSEAPADGKQYARKDGGWVEVIAGGSFAGTMDDITDGATYVKTHNDLTDALVSTIGTALQSETSHADVLVTDDVGKTVQGYDAGLVSDVSYVHTDNNFTNDAEGKVHAPNADISLGTQIEALDMGGYKVQNVADATIGNDVVNLHQVLELLPSERKFYLGETASALANYKKLVETAETTPRTITVTITANDQNIRSAVGDVGWITDANVPNITSLKAGTYKFHFYCKQTLLAGRKVAYLYAKMWNVDADGTSNANLLGTSSLTRLLSEVTADYNVDIHLASPVTIDATDRIIIKVYASLTGTGSNPEIVFGYGDLATTDAYQAFPINSTNLQDVIALKHTQGTDTGTTGNTFTIDSDSTTGSITIDVALNVGENHKMTVTNAVMTDDVTITIPATTGTLLVNDGAAIHTTTLSTDHIAEHTGAHGIVLDNDLSRVGKISVDHIAEATGSHTIVLDNTVQTGNIELGHASDTTLTRVSAGLVSIEGKTVLTNTTTSGVAATPTANGTQQITHGLGRVPTIIRIYGHGAKVASTSASNNITSIGVYSSSGNTCIYVIGGASAGQGSSATYAINITTSTGNGITGIIQNLTSTTFDIVWTEAGTSVAGVLLWEAQ